MHVYLLSYLILMMLSTFEIFVDSYNNKHLNRTLFVLVLVSLIIISGIRYQVGTDFSSYYNIFKTVNSMSKDSPYGYLEPIFKLIIIFFKGLNFPPYFLFFVFSLIMYTFLGIGVKKSSKLPFSSILIFLLMFMIGYLFNVLRQGIAMSILIFIIPDIKEKHFLKVFFFSLIAMAFHSTGIFILLSYFIYNINVKKSVYYLSTIISIIYFFNATKMYYLIGNILPPFIESKMISYMERFPGGVDFTSYLLRLIILFLFLFLLNKLDDNKDFIGVFNIYFFGFLLYTLFSFQGQAATRLNMFFRILEIILFPYLITYNCRKWNKFIMFGIIISISSVVFLSDLGRSANFPFQFFWEF